MVSYSGEIMSQQPKPLGSLGRLLQRREDLSNLKINPGDDDTTIKSYLSSPLTQDWEKSKETNLLKKLTG